MTGPFYRSYPVAVCGVSAVLVIGAAVCASLVSKASAQTPATVDYARDIQPLLRAQCYSCHGPAQQNGNLRVDRRRDVMPNRVGANNARIVPGKSAESRLYLRIAGAGAGLQMPPSGPLPAEQIALIRTWIDEGADWPDELAGDTPSAPEDPRAVELMDALRTGRRAQFDRVLRAFPATARSKGIGGSTPLMYAALYRDIRAARSLLDNGADPNARNDAGATALLWAVDDLEMTGLLLARGADPNVRSHDGETPLMLAAARVGGGEVVKALIDGGATLKGQTVFGRAAAGGDEALMRFLLERGAERSMTSQDLRFALLADCSGCIDLLLERASQEQLDLALSHAAALGDSVRMRQFVERGAVATGTVLRQAAASEKFPVDAIRLLLARGVRDDAALRFARGHGETPVVGALRAAGAVSPIPDPPRPTRSSRDLSAREAVAKSLPLLQRGDVGFLQGAGCVSCHNNSLFQMTAALARPRGFEIDEGVVAAQRKATGVYIESWRERVLQDIPIPGAADTISYILAGLAAEGYPPDPATDALARYLVRRQTRGGAVKVITGRAPLESSDFTVTALTIRALQSYAPAPLKASYLESVRRAAAWIRHAEPRTTEDHAYKLLGLVWARADRRAIRDAARSLSALQRADGGWSQIPTLDSDAYATGQALNALAESGLSPRDPVYRRGTRFLLDAQLDDGSWYVRSRVVPFQPYFESGFPHGTDQFISAAASNWATMALMRDAR